METFLENLYAANIYRSIMYKEKWFLESRTDSIKKGQTDAESSAEQKSLQATICSRS